MAITTPSQRCLIFNAAHPEFIDMSNIVEQIKENADRESELPDKLEEV